jgi:hypothetical protein
MITMTLSYFQAIENVWKMNNNVVALNTEITQNIFLENTAKPFNNHKGVAKLYS